MRRPHLLVVALLCAGLVACGSDDDDTATSDAFDDGTEALEFDEDDVGETDATEDDTAETTGAAAEPITPATGGFEFGTGPCPEPGGSPLPDTLTAPRQCIDQSRLYIADVETNFGSFTIQLAADEFPGTVNNFVVLSRYGYYDGTDCHRIIAGFVVQCGRRNGDERAPGYSIPDELPDGYSIGDIAMANTGQPGTGGAQFFIITGEQGASLPPQYSLVGHVIEGSDTVDALAANADPAAPNGVPPLAPVEITSITITES